MSNEIIEQPSWWKRNWKWALPVGGCLTVIILGIVLVVGGAFAFMSKVKTASGSDAALLAAQKNQEVIAILGEPIESNGFGSFNISYKNSTKTADASTPIKGPNGTATIYISTTGDDDDLVYEIYNVTIDDTGEIIELDRPDN